MVEIKSVGEYNLETFEIEYCYGNFTEEGERILPYKQFVAKVRNGEIKQKRGGGYIGNVE